MRRFSLAILPIVFSVFAQTSQTEPDTIDIFYALPKDQSAALVSLERQQTTFHAKASGFMVMGLKGFSEITGKKSPVRFNAGEALEFIVRSAFAASAADPNTFYALRSLQIKKNTREIIFMTGHASPLGASTKTDPSEGAIVLEFSKYATSSYKIKTPLLKLGEYALGRATMPQVVFCFGVD